MHTSHPSRSNPDSYSWPDLWWCASISNLFFIRIYFYSLFISFCIFPETTCGISIFVWCFQDFSFSSFGYPRSFVVSSFHVHASKHYKKEILLFDRLNFTLEKQIAISQLMNMWWNFLDWQKTFLSSACWLDLLVRLDCWLWYELLVWLLCICIFFFLNALKVVSTWAKVRLQFVLEMIRFDIHLATLIASSSVENGSSRK